MMDKPRVYLAGPDVFLPDAKTQGAYKTKVCEAHGLEGVFPLDVVLDPTGLKPIEFGFAIYQANIKLINSCAGVIADISSFRSPSADPGTGFEMGYATGLGLPVFGYTTAVDLYKDRLAAEYGPLTPSSDGRLYDRHGLAVEDFGMIDNLMLHGACVGQGMYHPFRPSAAGDSEKAFKKAVQAAAEFFSRRAVLGSPV